MTTTVSEQEVQWHTLHTDLTRLLSVQGRENAFGDGDFWIVDDNYGSFQHKVCVTRLAFLTQAIATSVENLLTDRYPMWEVLLCLDGPGLRPTPDDVGVMVRATGVEELWSRSRMAKAHSALFRWESANAG